jgi:D-amino-acid dehydrogenase
VLITAGVWSSSLLRRRGLRLPLQAAKGYSITAASNGTGPTHSLYLTETKIGFSPFKGAIRIAGTLELTGIDLKLTRTRVDALFRGSARYLHDWHPGEPKIEWAGLRPLTADGLPLIGALPGQDGLYVATGHGMLGVTLAPATAAALTPLILEGKHNPDLTPFRPERFTRR